MRIKATESNFEAACFSIFCLETLQKLTSSTPSADFDEQLIEALVFLNRVAKDFESSLNRKPNDL